MKRKNWANCCCEGHLLSLHNVLSVVTADLTTVSRPSLKVHFYFILFYFFGWEGVKSIYKGSKGLSGFFSILGGTVMTQGSQLIEELGTFPEFHEWTLTKLINTVVSGCFPRHADRTDLLSDRTSSLYKHLVWGDYTPHGQKFKETLHFQL